MPTRPPSPPPSTSTSQPTKPSRRPRQVFLSQPDNRRPSPWDTIDPNTIEIVDLTETSPPQPPPRRPLPSPTSERPSKRSKPQNPEDYISLDDDDEEEEDSFPSYSEIRKSPSQAGLLSQAKCVICLDSPTDLSATPCGTSTYAP